MEVKQFYFIPAGAVICVLAVLFFIFYKAKARGFKNGIKVANLDMLMSDNYIRGRLIAYKILRILLILTVVVAIMMSCVILARPYYTKKTKETKYNRDIMICLDISTSVDELNKKLVKDLKKLVKELNGERIGIVIFNTTPVILSPLTDDYEYILEQLDNIEEGLRVMSSSGNDFFKFDINESNNWLYWNNYLYGGTLVGNSERGSSLIGDGLLGALFSFPEDDGDRTKIIVFSTDNEPNGEGYVTLPEAAEYCRDNGVYVYGIGTKTMMEENLQEMKAAVERTKGKFYLEESANTFHRIVEEIEALSASLVEGRTIITQVEAPEKAFIILCISFLLMLIISIILRRVNVLFILVEPVIIALLILSYFYVIEPAKYANSGQGPDIKKESDLNVLFVIDNTISMLADDGAKFGVTRMIKVKEDCGNIIDELEGAKFSIISFNNDSQLLSPYTDNGDHAKNLINSIYPIDAFYAHGSSLNTPKQLMLTNLKKLNENKQNKTALFFISDGEITDESILESYKDVSEYIDFGAVLGYGTDDGGNMRVMDYMGMVETVQDYSIYPSEPAVSKIDEKNLKEIADDIGIDYINMTEGCNIDGLLSDIKKNINTKTTEIKPDNNGTLTVELPENKWIWLFAAVAFLMIVNAGYIGVRR